MKQDKDDLSQFIPASAKEQPVHHNLPSMKSSEDSGNTMQMLQSLMMRTRKDIQDKFNQQMKQMETKL